MDELDKQCDLSHRVSALSRRTVVDVQYVQLNSGIERAGRDSASSSRFSAPASFRVRDPCGAAAEPEEALWIRSRWIEEPLRLFLIATSDLMSGTVIFQAVARIHTPESIRLVQARSGLHRALGSERYLVSPFLTAFSRDDFRSEHGHEFWAKMGAVV